MKYFYLPIIYSFYTRINTVNTIVSFFVTFLLPVFLLSYACSINHYDLLFFVPLFICLLLSYEIGYIFNDFHTTRFENSPTYRVSKKQFKELEARYPIDIAFRVVIIIVILLFLSFYISSEKIIYFCLSLSLLNLSYSFHNYYRDWKNIITIFFLMIFKYFSVPIIYFNDRFDGYFLIAFVFMIPVIRTVLFTTHKRFNFSFIKKENIHKIRYRYYALFSIFSVLISLINSQFYYLSCLSILFFIFYYFGDVVKK